MAYARKRRFTKRKSPRTRKVFRRASRKRFNKRKAPSSGIGRRKMVKLVRMFDFTSTGTGTSSFNSLICTAAQSPNFGASYYFTGNSLTPVGTGSGYLEPTGSTGTGQWLSFYRYCFVHGSKIKIEIANNGPDPLIVTLVPTIGRYLANNGATPAPFDSSAIDPDEQRFAKRFMLGGNLGGGNVKKMSHYLSVKKMLNIKDLCDVLGVSGSSNSSLEAPIVPKITSITEQAWLSQATALPNPTTMPNGTGIYWNIIIRNTQGFLQTPGTPAEPDFTIRSIVTSYTEFADPIPLINAA